MSVERATGLILRTLPFAETSLIIRWLTPSWGRISTIAKGARRPKSPFRGKLDLFYEADFAFNKSRASGLHILREVVVLDVHSGLRKDYRALCQAAYCAGLVERVSEAETPVPALYNLLREAVKLFSAGIPGHLLVLAFELKLLGESGLSPDWPRTGLQPAAAKLGETLAKLGLADVSGMEFDPEARRDLAHFLNRFMQYHFGRIPKGREFAMQGHAHQEHQEPRKARDSMGSVH